MFPIGDQNPTRTTPFVNWILLVLNCTAFVWQYWLMATGGEAWVIPGYGLVATRLLNDPLGEAFTIFTSMFMHGGWGHLIGNMLYLYIFGDNVEDAIGHARYVVFYLASGVAAALVQVAIGPSSTIPMVGASGAIAGVLGGYMVLYPRAPITILNPVLPLWLLFGFFISLPAWLVIGFWFLGNVLSSLGTIGGAGGGVAFFAHIGGFLAGVLSIRAAVSHRNLRDPGRWSQFRPPERAPSRY